MSQVPALSGTALGRSSWPALRPLLVLGGFVAVWWALMTGVAQADGPRDQHHAVLDQVRSATAPHATPTVATATSTTTRTTRATRTVRKHTEPVTRRATSVVESTPVVGEVTKSATTTVSETVTKTRDALEKAAAGPATEPALEPVGDVVKSTTHKPQSSTGQGNSPSIGHSGPSTATPSAQQLLPVAFEAGGPGSADTAGSGRANPSHDGGSPLHGPVGGPSGPGPCASPSGSSSTSSTPVGTLESSLLVVPSVLRDIDTWRLARLPGGPAYEPGASPD